MSGFHFLHFVHPKGNTVFLNLDVIQRVELQGGKVFVFYRGSNDVITKAVLTGDEAESVLLQITKMSFGADYGLE